MFCFKVFLKKHPATSFLIMFHFLYRILVSLPSVKIYCPAWSFSMDLKPSLFIDHTCTRNSIYHCCLELFISDMPVFIFYSLSILKSIAPNSLPFFFSLFLACSTFSKLITKQLVPLWIFSFIHFVWLV